MDSFKIKNYPGKTLELKKSYTLSFTPAKIQNSVLLKPGSTQIIDPWIDQKTDRSGLNKDNITYGFSPLRK